MSLSEGVSPSIGKAAQGLEQGNKTKNDTAKAAPILAIFLAPNALRTFNVLPLFGHAFATWAMIGSASGEFVTTFASSGFRECKWLPL